MRKIGIVACAFFCLFLIGCGKGNTGKKQPEPSARYQPLALGKATATSPAATPPPASPAQAAKNPEKLSDLAEAAKKAREAEASKKTSAPAQKQSAASAIGPYSLAVLHSFEFIYPQDFDLGPLQGLEPADKEEGAMAKAAFDFLSALAKDKKVDASVWPERLRAVKQSIYPFTSSAMSIRAFRLGILKREGDSAQAKVFLYSDPGTALGEISVSQASGSWKVEAFSADFDALLKESPRRDKRFEPGEYQVYTPF
jgi:hypothetical protein